MNRRRFLGLACAAACTAVVGLPRVSQAASPGMVTFVFDDGLVGTYQYAYPVLRKYGFTGTMGIIATKYDSDNDDYMNAEQIKQMEKAGWEVASHGLTHKRITELPRYKNDELLTDWREDNPQSNIYQASYPYSKVSGVTENGQPLEAVLCMDELKHKVGSYFFDTEIGELHVRPLSGVHPSQLQVRVLSYESELELSKRKLLEAGFNVRSYVTPYNNWDEGMRQASFKYYDYICTGYDSFNEVKTFDEHAIRRAVVHTDTTVADLAKMVEYAVVGKGEWLVLCLHEIGNRTGWMPWSAERLDEFARYLAERQVRVVNACDGGRIMADLKQPREKALAAVKTPVGATAKGLVRALH